MRVQIIDNKTLKMRSALCSALEASDDVRIAVAFVSQQGLGSVMPSFQRVISSGGKIDFLVGLDFFSTDPQALFDVFKYSQTNPRLKMYCYRKVGTGGVYHPKLYLMRQDNQVSMIVGSSNLTAGGLERNTEVNLLVESDTQEQVISDSYDTFGRLKFDVDRVEPTQEFLKSYEALCAAQNKCTQQAKQNPETKALLREFKEKAALLRRPIPTPRDLVGWTERVYDLLPEGEFTNN